MPQTLDPVLIGPQAQTIQMPESPAAPVGLVVANESPWALQVVWGFESSWLDPWTADVVANTPDNWHALTLIPLQMIPTPNPDPPASLVLITVYWRGERIVGSWPATLARESSISNLDALGEAIADRTAQQISAALLPTLQSIQNTVEEIQECVCEGGGGGGGSEVQLQEFRTAGDFECTLPTGATLVHFRALGAGSGGGSGARQAAGTLSNGGFGGSGGFYEEFWIPAADLPNPVPISVGAGGTGAASVTTDNTGRAVGGAGGNSIIGTGGAFGVALGGNRNGAAGPGAGGGLAKMPPGNPGLSYAIGSTVTWAGAVNGGQAIGANGNGGGQGGTINADGTLVDPGYGGSIIGSGQVPNFYNPPFSPVAQAGSPSTSGQFAGTGGGGGAASSTAAGSPGLPGAAGSGGGGGGASLNGQASGAGGNGGDGFVIVEIYFG